MANAEKGRELLDRLAAERPLVHPAREYASQVRDLWANGMPAGDRTGWPSLDRLYTVQPGQFTVVTGWPGSGKSEWLDALLVNLSRQGWKFAMYSPENHPVEFHISKLMEKFSGKPFGHGPTERLEMGEVDEYIDEVSQAFGFIDPISGNVTVREVIEAATPYLHEFAESKRGLVIDPWNELEHWRPTNLSETEYVSHTLSYVRNWARANRVHVWIVAHPQKMRRNDDGELPIPRPDMVSGSQHWWNKADAAITVYRDFDNTVSDVDIYVQKIRFKHVGKTGMTTLRYDRVTGRYSEKPTSVAEYREARGF